MAEFWIRDPSELLKSRTSRANREMQKSILLTIVLFLLSRSLYSFVILGIGAWYSYYLEYYFYREKNGMDKQENAFGTRVMGVDGQLQVIDNTTSARLDDPVRLPTAENPMGNYQLTDINDPNEPIGNNLVQGSEQYRRMTTDAYKQGQFDYMSDLFSDNYSSLQFYTVPNNSSIPDPNGDFQNWLYGSTRPSCKEDPRFCELHPYTIEGGGIGEPNGGRTQNNWLDIEVALDLRKKLLTQ